MSSKCTEINIIRGETIDATIELTFRGSPVDASTMQVSYEIVKDPSKDVVVAKNAPIVGSTVFVSSAVTTNLLGMYYLRVHILHGQNTTIEDIRMEVRK